MARKYNNRMEAIMRVLKITIKSNGLIVDYFKIDIGQSRVNNYLCTVRIIKP
jgi:hypothetical protein